MSGVMTRLSTRDKTESIQKQSNLDLKEYTAMTVTAIQTKVEMAVVDLSQAREWEMICDAASDRRRIVSLTEEQRIMLYRNVCLENDCYNGVGNLAGFNWPGIRDSSPAAHKRMVVVIRRFFQKLKLKTYTVERS